MFLLKTKIMKTKIITLLLFAIFSINSFAQDVITKKDGTKLKVTIQKVTKNNIKYILFNDPNKVTYTIDKFLISNVEFAFNKSNLDVNDPEKNPSYFAEDQTNNIMLNFSAFSGNTFAFAYERALKPGQSIMGELKIYGLGSKPDFEEKRSGFGFDVHYRLKTKSFFNKKEYRPQHIFAGPYFAPTLGFSTGSRSEYRYQNTTQSYKHNIFHFGIQYGNQWIIQRKLSVDTSFGFHYYFGSQTGSDEYESIRLGNMVGERGNLFSFNLRIGFLTGKSNYKIKDN